MKPAAFDYHRPASRGEALTLLASHGGDAKPLAGGQSLIPAMNFRLAMPAVLVDLNAIADLSYITRQGNDLRIGAMTRHRAVERSEDVRVAAPLVHEAMPFIAHAAIRTRGTIGGSLAHADPAAELPAVMLALDARIRVENVQGSREVPAADFFTGLFSTALESGELVTEITIPATQAAGSRTGTAFEEFSQASRRFRAGWSRRARRRGWQRPLHARADRALRRRRSADARIQLCARARGPVAVGRDHSGRRRRRRARRHRSDERHPRVEQISTAPGGRAHASRAGARVRSSASS